MSTTDATHSGDSRKLLAAKASIGASALLAVGKLAAGLTSGSLALLSEAGHAAVDTGATILTFFAVREAEKPADDEHHYGHGKFESLAALIETGFLFGLALFVVGEGWRRLSQPPEMIDAGWLAFAVLGVSMLVDATRWVQLSKIAREEGSEALAADALHFSSDLVSSAFVLVGLIAAQAGYPQGDALAAFAVAAFIAIAGFRLGRRTIETLLDAAPQDLAPRIARAIADTPGVIEVESLRLRKVGSEVIGEAVVGVARTLSVEQAARIKDNAAAAILAIAPQANVTLAAQPRALDDETVIERILLVAAHRHLPVHRILTQLVGERLSISLDMEVDGAMPHGRAPAIAADFEAALCGEFGADSEINTHIEPLAAHILSGADAPESLCVAVEATLREAIGAAPEIFRIDHLRVRETAGGLVVNYHCSVDPASSVESVHAAVDAAERAARDRFPQILRIIGHAEPTDPRR